MHATGESLDVAAAASIQSGAIVSKVVFRDENVNVTV
jgi:hypothetical protein